MLPTFLSLFIQASCRCCSRVTGGPLADSTDRQQLQAHDAHGETISLCENCTQLNLSLPWTIGSMNGVTYIYQDMIENGNCSSHMYAALSIANQATATRRKGSLEQPLNSHLWQISTQSATSMLLLTLNVETRGVFRSPAWQGKDDLQ